MSSNGLLSGSTSRNHKTRKDWCPMDEQKILGYILFSSLKWDNIPENKSHPYKHGIQRKSIRAWILQRRETAATELMIGGKK